MTTKKEQLKSLKQKFHVIMRKLLRKFPPKSARKRKEMERKILEAENREFRRVMLSSKIRQNWLDEDIDQAMNNLLVTLELGDQMRRAKPGNTKWLM
jgi:hypothetical protein